MKNSPLIELRTSPHVKASLSLPQIMRQVIYALLPICAFSIYLFGLSAIALLIVVTLSCVLTEMLLNKISNSENTLNDYSVVITGILLALTLPPGFPLWMGAVAGFIAISLGKHMFGGIGFNVFNPALLGRAFVQAAFPVAITTWSPAGLNDRFTQFIPSTLTLPFTQPEPVDAFSGATPLALQKFEATSTDLSDLFLGINHGGSLGETSALLILLCGLYLISRRMMGWRIPVAIFVGAAVFSGLLYLIDNSNPGPLFMLSSGGLMLGALFMATDPVTAPVTPKGMWMFGLLIGVLTVIIRLFGGLPEGIMYAILLANAAVPLIDVISQPRKFGQIKQDGQND